ncbi:MAG: hypothetical protein IJT69_04540 [Clostridia bacterium]|nr:hypothetical protein [Clostridia bacterium]
MSRFRRLLIVIMLLTVAFAFCYAAFECVHDCHGEVDCPICRVVAILSSVCLPALLFTLLFVAFLRRERAETQGRCDFAGDTLVRLKVKLSA